MPTGLRNIVIIVAVALAASCGPAGASKVVELKFAEPPAAESDTARTLASVVTVRGIDARYSTGGVYLITQYGDRADLFETENKRLLEEPWIDQPWRFCSVFSSTVGDSVIVGRNWDNQNVGSIVISLYRPSGWHASISFCRAIDLGFGENLALDEMAKSPYGERLLLAPFYSMDGINDRGLVVAVAGLPQREVRSIDDAQLRVFISYMVRKILDRAANVKEAVLLADVYVPFDLKEGVMNGHILIADAAGRSAILEYVDDSWRAILPANSWQVMTTKPIFDVPDADLRESCRRYKTISEALEGAGWTTDWKAGMKVLRSVQQNGTTWSVVYSPTSLDLHFCVYQEWDTVYHLKAF
jgi:hypothetical protein